MTPDTDKLRREADDILIGLLVDMPDILKRLKKLDRFFDKLEQEKCGNT